MRLAKLALATYLLLWTLAGLVGIVSSIGAYALCRGPAGTSCTHALVMGCLSFVIGAGTGFAAYLLLRDRWRRFPTPEGKNGLRPATR
jgi:hypothetical protein